MGTLRRISIDNLDYFIYFSKTYNFKIRIDYSHNMRAEYCIFKSFALKIASYRFKYRNKYLNPFI